MLKLVSGLAGVHGVSLAGLSLVTVDSGPGSGIGWTEVYIYTDGGGVCGDDARYSCRWVRGGGEE